MSYPMVGTIVMYTPEDQRYEPTPLPALVAQSCNGVATLWVFPVDLTRGGPRLERNVYFGDATKPGTWYYQEAPPAVGEG